MATVYTKRPPANCRGARIAWDLLTRGNVPHGVESMWHAPEMQAWAAFLTNGDTADVDVNTVASHRRDPEALARVRASNATALAKSHNPST